MWKLACLLALAGHASAQLSLDGIRCGQLTCQLEEYCSPETNRCAPCSVVCNKTHHNYDSGLCSKECQGYLLDLRYMRRSDSVQPSSDISSDWKGVAAGTHWKHEGTNLALNSGSALVTDFEQIDSMKEVAAGTHKIREATILALRNSLGGVQRQAQTALIVSGVALAVFVLSLIIVCRGNLSWRYFKQKFQPTKNRVKHFPADLTHHNPHAEMPKPKHELKLEIRNPEPPKRQQQPLNVKDLETRTSQTDRSQGATTPKTISTALSNRHPAEDTTLDFSYENMAMNTTPPEQPATSHKF